MASLRYLPTLIAALFVAVPVHASDGIPLPEPSSLFLLGMGITGVVVGRRFSRRKGED